MILDKIENLKKYLPMHPDLELVNIFFIENELGSIPAETTELKGKDVYVLYSDKQGKKPNEAKLEAHRKYIDIQMLISGEEQIGWKAYKDCKNITEPYNEEKDIMFFGDESQTYLKLTPGTFAIFFPNDAHAPMISDGNVRKCVVKIKI